MILHVTATVFQAFYVFFGCLIASAESADSLVFLITRSKTFAMENIFCPLHFSFSS